MSSSTKAMVGAIVVASVMTMASNAAKANEEATYSLHSFTSR